VPTDDSDVDKRIEDLPTLRSQRRFLEVMSLVCAAYYWFDVRINTEGSYFGQSVHIGSTRYALTALWIGLLWAAWRYGQQLYRASQPLSAAIRSDYRTELSRLAKTIVQRYVSRMPASDRRAFGAENCEPHVVGVASLGHFDFEKAKRFDTNHNEVAPQLPFGPLGEHSHAVIDAVVEWLVDDGGTRSDFGFGIGRGQTASLKTRAAIAAIVRRPVFFDYVTPGLMFLFAILSLALRAIYGPVTTVCV
jgi:hypothetical protein